MATRLKNGEPRRGRVEPGSQGQGGWRRIAIRPRALDGAFGHRLQAEQVSKSAWSRGVFGPPGRRPSPHAPARAAPGRTRRIEAARGKTRAQGRRRRGRTLPQCSASTPECGLLQDRAWTRRKCHLKSPCLAQPTLPAAQNGTPRHRCTWPVCCHGCACCCRCWRLPASGSMNRAATP